MGFDFDGAINHDRSFVPPMYAIKGSDCSITRQDVNSESLNRSDHHSCEGLVTTRVQVLEHHRVPCFGEDERSM
jgi:hypothetical protein